MKKSYSAWVLSIFVLGACGSSGTSAQQAAQTLCDKVCSCSSTCTVAAPDANNQPKDPIAFGSSGACQSFYAPFLSPGDGAPSIDPTACASAVPNAQCWSDSAGNHYLNPPSACARSVGAADAGSD